jgi:hypothetical protein
MPKFVCPVETYEDCFIEISDQWSRADVRNFSRSSGEEYIELVKSKVTAIHIRTFNGVIDSPAKFTEKNLDAVYWPVFSWLMTTPGRTVQETLNLGEAIRRQSSQAQEESQE